jgi:uncharacterized protein YkwD
MVAGLSRLREFARGVRPRDMLVSNMACPAAAPAALAGGLLSRPASPARALSRVLLVGFGWGLVFAAVGCASTPAKAAADDSGGDVAPFGRGAARYFAPPAQGSGEESLSDPLARSLYDLVVKLAGPGRAPRPDIRLAAVADTLAETLGPEEVPGIELQEFLVSHFGLGEALPVLEMFQFGVDDEGIRNKFAGRLPATMRGGPFGRVGIGIRRRFFGRTSVVVALQRIEIELLPVPRQLARGESTLIGGQLLGRSNPSVLVAPPRGEVLDLPVRGGQSFRTTFRCDTGDGRYQVEIFGTGSDGKAMVANFPIYCGVEPPRTVPRAMAAGPETGDARAAEKLAFASLNRDRQSAGLPVVAWDETLARAARGYSEEMARRQVVEHVSRESGNAADRIRRVGVRAVLVRENVGRANSIADAQRSFMSSPGHRANVLARGMTRAAVGVALRKDGGGAGTVYITQLFVK